MIYSAVLKCPSIVQQGQKPWNYQQSTTGAFGKNKKIHKKYMQDIRILINTIFT